MRYHERLIGAQRAEVQPVGMVPIHASNRDRRVVSMVTSARLRLHV